MTVNNDQNIHTIIILYTSAEKDKKKKVRNFVFFIEYLNKNI